MKKYWVYLKNMTLGPFSQAELLALPGFNPTTPVCQEDLAGGEGDWLRADQVAEFRDLFPASASPDAALPPMGLGTALARDLGTPPEFLLYEAQKQIDELHNAIARKESEGGAKEHMMSSLRMELLRKNRQLDDLLAERKRLRKLSDDLREGNARKGRQIEALQSDLEHIRSQVRDLRQAVGRKTESSEQESRVSEALLDWFLTHFRPKGTLQAKAVRQPKPRLKTKVERLLSAFEQPIAGASPPPAASAPAPEEGGLGLGASFGAGTEDGLGLSGAPAPAPEEALGAPAASEAAEGSLGLSGAVGTEPEGSLGGLSEGLSLSGDADAPLSFSLDQPEPVEAPKPPSPEPAEEIEFLPTALEAGMEPPAPAAEPPPPAPEPVPEEKPVEVRHVFAGMEFIPPPPRKSLEPPAVLEVPAFDPAEFAGLEPAALLESPAAVPPPVESPVPPPMPVSAVPAPAAAAAAAAAPAVAKGRRRRAGMVLGAVILVIGGVFAVRWKRGSGPAGPAAEIPSEIPAVSVPAPTPVPAVRPPAAKDCASSDGADSAQCRAALERVQSSPAVQGMTVKAFLASMSTPKGRRSQRWEVSQIREGSYRVDFLAGIRDPATNAELVYSFRADLSRGEVKGLNMPAEAVLPTP